MKVLFQALAWGFGDQVGRQVGHEVVRAGIDALTEDTRRHEQRKAVARARRNVAVAVAIVCTIGLALTVGVWLGHAEWALGGLFLLGLLAALGSLLGPGLSRRVSSYKQARAVERT